MKKRLEKSVDEKNLKLRPPTKQKVGAQVSKWLKENPGFEQAVVKKLTPQHRLEVKSGSRVLPKQ